MMFSVECDAREFLRALTRVKPATSAKGWNYQVSGRVRLSAAGNGILTVRATDLDLFLGQDVTATSAAGETLDVVVDHALAMRWAAKAVAAKASTVQLGSDGSTVTFNADGFVALNTETALDTAEFPAWPVPGDETMIVDLDAVAHCLPYMSSDNTRPVLCSVHIEVDAGGATTYVATDSYRLGSVATTAPTNHLGPKPRIPLAAAKTLVGWLVESRKKGGAGTDGLVEATYGGDHLTVVTPDRFQITHHSTVDRDGEYPNWKSLVRDDSPCIVTFDRDEMVKAVGQLSSMKVDDTKPVKLERADNDAAGLMLSISGDSGGSTVSKRINGTIDLPGCIAFNPAFLVPAFQTHSAVPDMDTGAIEVVDHLKPGLISDTVVWQGRTVRRLNLLMPVKVD